jgi:tetratricopeptide (TPR) repeat protein
MADRANRCRRLGVALAALAAFAIGGQFGCRAKAPPDPNDPAQVGIMRPEVLQNNLRWASEMINDRVARAEITEEEGEEYLRKYADELVAKINFDKAPSMHAWRYGEIFRAARRWDLAEPVLEKAVEYARKGGNQDRRVNDSLRLAQTYAELGKPEKAIEMARSVYDAPETDKAPILYSVLYEVVPAIRNHAEKISNPQERERILVDSARMTEAAIGQHLSVIVNPKEEAGAKFLATKWHHVRKGWEMVFELYRDAGREDLAQEAQTRAAEMGSRQGRA